MSSSIAFAFWLSAPLRHAPMPRVQARWYDLVLRAGMVAVLVGVVVSLSFRIGPTASGNLAVFPIVLSSIAIILHRRVGGPATAAVLANAVIGLGGFAVALVVLYLTAERFGSAAALTLAFAASLGCNLLLYLVRQRGLRKTRAARRAAKGGSQGAAFRCARGTIRFGHGLNGARFTRKRSRRHGTAGRRPYYRSERLCRLGRRRQAARGGISVRALVRETSPRAHLKDLDLEYFRRRFARRVFGRQSGGRHALRLPHRGRLSPVGAGPPAKSLPPTSMARAI